MFGGVGAVGGASKFGDIVPVPGPGVELSGIELQYLTYDGSSDEEEFYIWDGDGNVWLRQGWEDATDMPIPPGQGMWVGNGSYGEVKFQSAGEVRQSEIEFPINDEGGTAVGNSFPCAITFNDITPIPGPGVELSGIELQYLTYDGSSDDEEFYIWDGDSNIWLRQGWEEATDMPIPAGKGMWVGNGSYGQVTIHISAPEFN